MLEFFKRLFNPEPSSVTARERLRLVLLSDHLALAPDVVESLKTDLIAVISKYVDVDAANCDVTFEQQDTAGRDARQHSDSRHETRRQEERPAPAPEPPPALDPQPAASVAADALEGAAPKPRRRRRRRATANATPVHG